MRYVATVASGILLASGLSLASAEEPSLDLPAPVSTQQQSKQSLPSTSQAAYVVPVEIREILEQQSAARAAAAAASPQTGAPQMNQSTR